MKASQPGGGGRYRKRHIKSCVILRLTSEQDNHPVKPYKISLPDKTTDILPCSLHFCFLFTPLAKVQTFKNWILHHFFPETFSSYHSLFLTTLNYCCCTACACCICVNIKRVALVNQVFVNFGVWNVSSIHWKKAFEASIPSSRNDSLHIIFFLDTKLSHADSGCPRLMDALYPR